METKFNPISQTSWDLADLFPSPDSGELEIAFRTLEEQSGLFEAYRAKLTDSLSVESFLEIIRHLEKISNLGNRLYGYSSLLFTRNTQDQLASPWWGAWSSFQPVSLTGFYSSVCSGRICRMKGAVAWWIPLPGGNPGQCRGGCQPGRLLAGWLQ